MIGRCQRLLLSCAQQGYEAISYRRRCASSLFTPQVLFKMVLGSAKFGEAALFLSIVGSANFVFISFVPVILYVTHVEHIGSPEDIPWAFLCGVAGLLFGGDTRIM